MKVSQVVRLCGLALACGTAIAQPDYAFHAPIGQAPVDPAITRALITIKPQQIQQTIKTLVGFGTRNTLLTLRQIGSQVSSKPSHENAAAALK